MNRVIRTLLFRKQTLSLYPHSNRDHKRPGVLISIRARCTANDGTICYVKSGFLGHQNNSQRFMLMKQIGMYLPFPDDKYLLEDSICPNRDDEDAICMSTDIPKTGKCAT